MGNYPLLVIDNSQNTNSREASALTLCRNILEACQRDYSSRYTLTPEGEIITFDSAVEILDGVISSKVKNI